MNFWDNKFTAFLAYSNIWVGLSAAALAALSQIYFNTINYNYVAFTFFGTMAFYGYARFFEGETLQDNKSDITEWHLKHRTLLWILLGLSGIGTCYFLVTLSINAIITLVICGALGLLYPIPYILGGWSGIRHVAGLKLFMIALIWTIVTAVIPAFEVGLLYDRQSIVHLLQRFLFITAITIPFDIRDTTTDHPDIDTIPIKFGIQKARIIILLIGLVVEASFLLQYLQGTISGYHLIALFIGVEIAMVLSYRSFPIKRDLYYSFLIEGTPILMFLMVLIFNYF